MRDKIITYLKMHPAAVCVFWSFMRSILKLIACFLPTKDKTMLFSSFGGRNFDDSPKAIYDEICSRKEFDDWEITWAFINPDAFNLERGKKVKIDTLKFFFVLLTSKVWVSNSEIDRGIDINRRQTVRIETWHGTPLKKICGDEHSNAIGGNTKKNTFQNDSKTIRCAQSKYDRDIFARIFNADKGSFLLCDLPRNDALLSPHSNTELLAIKNRLNIKDNKKVILYTPTYREYLINSENKIYLAPPIDLRKWERLLSDKYVLLIRAHYAVAEVLNFTDNDFVKNISNYPSLNELYLISDILISDYSSTFIDYSILERPMFCFAYDLEEYEEKRGLYLDLQKVLPCSIDKTEDDLLENILTFSHSEAIERTKTFRARFAPYAGNAAQAVANELSKRLKQNKRNV